MVVNGAPREDRSVEMQADRSGDAGSGSLPQTMRPLVPLPASGVSRWRFAIKAPAEPTVKAVSGKLTRLSRVRQDAAETHDDDSKAAPAFFC